MNVKEIQNYMAQEGWRREVAVSGQDFYFRADDEFGVEIVNGDWWELGRVCDGGLNEFVSGETKAELEVALIMLDVLTRKRECVVCELRRAA